MRQAKPPQDNKISRILVIYVLLFSSMITLVLTAIQLYNDYRYDLTLIDRRLSQIEIANMAGLSRHMWTLNEAAIQLQLEGLLKLPDMVYLELVDADGGRLASAGTKPSENMIERRYPASYEHRDTMHRLGELRAVATLEHVYQRLIDTFIVILITQGVKTFLVSAFIIFIVARLITRHLGRISEHTRQLDPRNPQGPLRLKRRANRMNIGDELDQMVVAYNTMQDNIRDTYAQLAYNRNVLEKAQQIAHIGSWEMDPRTGEVYWSDEAKTIMACGTGTPNQGFQPYLDTTHPGDRTALIDGLKHTRETGEPLFIEHRLNCGNGNGNGNGNEKIVEFRAQLYNDHGKAQTRLIGTVHDVTEQCRQRTALRNLANFDSLTGLPNRWLLTTRLEQTIASSRLNRSTFILALLDLDGFKEVNDSLGHHVGDQLLSLIKPRLDPLLREGDTLARLGGDEFAIVLNPTDNQAEAIELIEAITDAMNAPFSLDIMQVQVGTSIGISRYPDQATDASTLLRYADVAMYHAKRNKLPHSFYSTEIDPHTPRRLELLSDIRRAIEHNQLVLHYQPKIFAEGSQVEGAEALVRWRHPIHGMIGPDEFVPLCEISDIIQPLTLWVINQALADCLSWQNADYDIGVSVNVSVRNMLDNKFPDEVVKLLGRHQLRPSTLTLEITESALMEDPKRAKQNIDRLHLAGVKVSIDDFGTGYSSLSYLKHLTVEELKIDRGFVADMLTDKKDAMIVHSTVELAHGLGLKVTAEGVETALLAQQLRTMGCDQIQGYHIARPMPHEQLKAWLANWSGLNDDGMPTEYMGRASV